MARLFPVLALTVASAFVWPQSMMLGLTGKVSLVSMPSVKKELKLTKEQEKQINAMLSELQKNPAEFGGMIDTHYMSRPIDKKIVEILGDAQNARLQELFLQVNGLLTLSEDDVCASLGLDEGAKAKARARIKEHDDQAMEAMMDVQRTRKLDKKKLKEIDDTAQADLLAMLTPDHAEKWKTMLGKAFKIPELRR